jgi:hypothetical protein
MESSLSYSDSSCSIIYAIDPLNLPNSTSLIIDSLSTIQKQTAGCPNLTVAYQVIPIYHIVQRDDLLQILKEIAFSIFCKARRITTGTLILPDSKVHTTNSSFLTLSRYP